MVKHKTMLFVTDNSGVRFVKCLKVVRTVSAFGKKQIAKAGDLILVSVRITKFLEKIKKGQLFKALIVRTKRPTPRLYGSVTFNENAVILLNKKLEPVGNRIFGPISREALEQNFVKLSSIKTLDI